MKHGDILKIIEAAREHYEKEYCTRGCFKDLVSYYSGALNALSTLQSRIEHEKIDEILDNLAKSIGTEIVMSKTGEGYDRIQFVPTIYSECFLLCDKAVPVFWEGVNEIETKATFLGLLFTNTKIAYFYKNKTKNSNKYIFNKEKIIFEPYNILPCLYCHREMVIIEKSFLEDYPNTLFYYHCEGCGYSTYEDVSKECTIEAHNEIYKKVHGEKK